MPYHLYAYDSYGATTEGGGYYGDQLASYKGYDKGPFGYKTGVRQYDPETGRFLSPDAFKGYMTDPASQHPYMYCRGNPVRYSDPSGYLSKEEREAIRDIRDGGFWILGGLIITQLDSPLLGPLDILGGGIAATGTIKVAAAGKLIAVYGIAKGIVGSMKLSKAMGSGKGKGPKFKSRDALRKHNKEFRDVAKKLKLNKGQQRQLHEYVTGRNYNNYHKLLDAAKELFNIR
ncbi:MAG: hypothetical protein K8T10_18320 [Candidatus Eremiobacteraeota bacterium]|nr:hypothetical protein [Candidatus Eremiobacteraeota bacterium]